jgi:hypothetical protein
VKIREIVITVALCTTALVATHWISEGQRYEVVASGAGSGGSQDSIGSTEVRGFLVDRKTGRTWSLRDVGGMPMDLPDGRYSCKQMSLDWVESDSGCEIPRKP